MYRMQCIDGQLNGVNIYSQKHNYYNYHMQFFMQSLLSTINTIENQ